MTTPAVATPTSPLAHPSCDGFVILMDRSGESGLVAATHAVAQALGKGWNVESLGKGSAEFEVVRASGNATPVPLCWERANILGSQPGVLDAEPSLVVPGIDPPNSYAGPAASGASVPQAKSAGSTPRGTPAHDSLWSLQMVRAIEAWGIAPPSGGKRLGEGIRVGHPDTGYTRHPEIFGRFETDLGYDFECNQADALDPLSSGARGHGAATASVIASPKGRQLTSASEPIEGIAPGATVVPLRVSSSVVHLSFRKLAKAIRHAADQGCHVISMSLGGPFNPNYLGRAIDYAISKGVILLAAAGNKWPFVVYPARLPQVVAVAACNHAGGMWSGSATGSTVDVTAPGEHVWRAATAPGNSFSNATSSGTSYAVATTAGACALWLAFHGRSRLVQRYGRNNLAALFGHLLKTKGVSTPAGWNTKKHGTGIVNVVKLLEAPLPASASVAPAPKSGGPMRELAGYFPDLPLANLQAALETAFGVKGKALEASRMEIAFHLATNPALRVRIAKAASPTVPGAKSPLSSSKSLMKNNPNLRKFASKRLRGSMGID